FTDSANKYRGYKLTYNDNTLYIKIKGSLLSFNGSAGDFNISINNNFGNIIHTNIPSMAGGITDG
ncbi:hypothetical protein AML91_03635, partial [Paenibacillus jilunlii]